MEQIDYVLDFATHLGKEMLACGANLERVNLTMELICKVYGYTEVSINSTTTFISVCAKNSDGVERIYQETVPAQGINLEKLRRLNALSYQVREERPDVTALPSLLEEAGSTKGYPWYLILGGYLLAMLCLGRIFHGVWQDLIIIAFNTCILFGMGYLWKRAHLNRIITNVVNMLFCGLSASFFYQIGFVQQFQTVVITNAFYLIPGIQMVNAMRNILCGNEMNGIIELLKVVLEVVTIVAGLWLAFYIGGSLDDKTFDAVIVEKLPPIPDYEIIFISFLCSFGFSVVFGIRPKDLVWAGLGGTLIRIVLIFMINATGYRLIFMAVPAFGAALYAEILANIKKMPATILLYPSIVPLIPGDFFYYAMVGIIITDADFFNGNAFECIMALVGISVGFVICSTFVHYIRKIKLRKLLPIHGIRHKKEK